MESNKLKKCPINNAIKPNKLLGQHFLRDKNVLDKIIGAANLTKNDTVLEIGPGLGVLTKELAKYAGQVVAVEKDKTLAELLIKQLADEKIDNVKIVAGDILKFPISNFQFPNKSQITNPKSNSYKVVANIPYYLTSHLIRLLLESPDPPQDIVLLIQKEVAKRICAKPPEMSLLAVSVQFYATAKIIASVSRKSFRPQPKVDSAIIKMTPRGNPNIRIYPNAPNKNSDERFRIFRAKGEGSAFRMQFFQLLHAGFSHPRKQLLGNLSGELVIAKEKISLALAKAGIKNSRRAETLTVEDWIALSRSLFV